MVWLLFIVFRHDFLKRKFLKLFVLVPTPFFVFDRNLLLFCLLQMNVKEKLKYCPLAHGLLLIRMHKS